MKIEITHQMTPDYREIYGFVYDQGNNTCIHTSTMKSYLDPNGVWGDEWNEKYSDKRTEEIRNFEHEYLEETGDEWVNDSWYSENVAFSKKHNKRWSSVLKEIEDRYNPCHVRHSSGKVYYSGTYTFFNLPHPPVDSEKLLASIKAELQKLVDSVTIVLSPQND